MENHQDRDGEREKGPDEWYEAAASVQSLGVIWLLVVVSEKNKLSGKVRWHHDQQEESHASPAKQVRSN